MLHALLFLTASLPTSSFSAVISTEHLLNQKTLRICIATEYEQVEETTITDFTFANPDQFYTALEKNEATRLDKINWIRETIKNSAFEKSTGRGFEGWNLCSEAGEYQKSDIVLVVQKDFPTAELEIEGEASLGTTGSKKYSKLGITLTWTNLEAANTQSFDDYFGAVDRTRIRKTVDHYFKSPTDWSPALQAWEDSFDCPSHLFTTWIQESILHEFGHLVGLFHEQAKPQNRDRAQYFMPSLWKSMDTSISEPHKSYGSGFDPASVMMYGRSLGHGLFAITQRICEMTELRARLKSGLEKQCDAITSVDINGDLSENDQLVLSKAYQTGFTPIKNEYKNTYLSLLKTLKGIEK